MFLMPLEIFKAWKFDIFFGGGGVNFCFRDFQGGLLEALEIFLGLIFAFIRSFPSLEIRSLPWDSREHCRILSRVIVRDALYSKQCHRKVLFI